MMESKINIIFLLEIVSFRSGESVYKYLLLIFAMMDITITFNIILVMKYIVNIDNKPIFIYLVLSKQKKKN